MSPLTVFLTPLSTRCPLIDSLLALIGVRELVLDFGEPLRNRMHTVRMRHSTPWIDAAATESLFVTTLEALSKTLTTVTLYNPLYAAFTVKNFVLPHVRRPYDTQFSLLHRS